ncbi:hypothetical protein FB45DRAFT_1080120 [Roridomyces roridus]|uniref:F-box domain-containing protein n=1 Tax=Roridomyces roridus TaxID=1738132 RepID=A0AAD7FML6_9AGAR|nr:hypothetical protein FB45DRAFT_1080120 [Roridomyces roridus]
MSVCHAWSELALATPALWTNICDTGVVPAKFPLVFKTWLARGGNVSVSVSTRRVGCPMSVFGPKDAHRLERIDGFWDYDIGAKTHTLRGLKSVTFARQAFEKSFFSADHLLDLVGRAPQLEECAWILHKDAMVMQVLEGPKRQSSHATLQHLRLESAVKHGPDIINNLALPALVTLTTSFSESADTLHRFLQRSSPPLRTLKIRSDAKFDANKGHFAFLSLVPALTELELKMEGYVSSYDTQPPSLLEFLTTTAPDALPNLRKLELEEHFEHAKDGYAHVVEFVAKRSASLRSLRLHCRRLTYKKGADPFSNVPEALRELAQGGIHIHVQCGRDKEDILNLGPLPSRLESDAPDPALNTDPFEALAQLLVERLQGAGVF